MTLTSPLAWAQQRFEAWWQSRHRPTDHWTLTQNNVYIVPTRAGLAYALTLLVLLIASINYQLNLGYLLTFLLAGSGTVSMLITHRTLRGLTLHMRPPEAVFVGEPAVLEVVLSGDGPARYGIALRVRTAQNSHQLERRRFARNWTDVPAGGRASAHVSFMPQTRGRHDLPILLAETRFPFGLFRAWTIWRPAAQVLVYPRPEQPCPPLPAPQSANALSSPQRPRDGGEFEGVRPWQRGDAPKRVLWKKFARAGELVSRDTRSAQAQTLWLDYQQTGSAAPEHKLSRLTAWVLHAHHNGYEWGLRLPGVELAVAQGDAHRRACLQALALYP